MFWFCFVPLHFSLKFVEDQISGCWYIHIWIFWGRLKLEVVFINAFLILVWSPELKFKIWWSSDQWLLKYLTFYIWISFKHFLFFVGPLILSFKIEEEPTSGCWDIQFLIFWGRLPLKVVFHWRLTLCQEFLIFEHKFKICGNSDQWLLRYSTFNILRSSSFWGRLHMKCL